MSDLDNLRDNMRRQEPSELARVAVTRDIDGHKLSLEVSPCSWLYPGYGLQVQITLHGGGGHAYIHNKELHFEKATMADLERMFDQVKLVPCKKCGKPAFDPATVDTNRAGECEECFMDRLNAELKKAQEKEDRRMRRLDATHRAQGYTHRIDAWIHGGGDDRQVSFYSKGKLTTKEVKALIRKQGSMKDDDFTIVTL
ncbi:MAG: hypothetical protein OEL20_04970 [Sulfuritalea sp.]|nr:hypothetical protein [Sulfuritalea sp.]